MLAYTALPFPARCAFSDSAGRRWGNRNLDVLAAQKSVQDMQLPAFPLEVAKPASMTELDAQEAYFRENKAEILDNLHVDVPSFLELVESMYIVREGGVKKSASARATDPYLTWE